MFHSPIKKKNQNQYSLQWALWSCCLSLLGCVRLRNFEFSLTESLSIQSAIYAVITALFVCMYSEAFRSNGASLISPNFFLKHFSFYRIFPFLFCCQHAIVIKELSEYTVWSPKTCTLNRSGNISEDIWHYLSRKTCPLCVITLLLISPFPCSVWLISAWADLECHRQSQTSSFGQSAARCRDHRNPIQIQFGLWLITVPTT